MQASVPVVDPQLPHRPHNELNPASGPPYRQLPAWRLPRVPWVVGQHYPLCTSVTLSLWLKTANRESVAYLYCSWWFTHTNLRSHRPKQDTLSRLLCQRRGESSSKALFSSIYATAGYSLVGILQNFPGHSWSPIANYEQLRPLGKLHYATGFKKCHSGSYPYTSSPIAVFPPCQNCCSKT